MVEPVVLTVPGELDAASSPAFRDEVAFYLAVGVRRVELDLVDVRFIDSSGVGALIALTKRAAALGVELVLRNVGANAQTTLRVSGAATVLPIEA